MIDSPQISSGNGCVCECESVFPHVAMLFI